MALPGKNERILIVDDDEGLLILMAEALREEHYSVMTADSGAAALAAIGREAPDLMLLDFKLHDMDGTELLKRLKERSLAVPFIVVTGRGDEKVAVETMKEGALDYVMKDTGLLDLLPSVVKRVLAGVERDRALAQSQIEGHRLENEIIAISERERYNIGADLHDGLGQQLTAIELICAALKEDMAGFDADLRARVDQMGRMLREAITQTRILSRGLVPVKDDPEALRIALAELADQINSSGKVRCRFECAAAVTVLDPPVVGQLYRIAQEAVNNAVKHAQASEIVIRLRDSKDGPWLQISDNGRGLPKGEQRGTGMGLRLMHHRAVVIGANLIVSSKKEAGVTITCSIGPLK